MHYQEFQKIYNPIITELSWTDPLSCSDKWIINTLSKVVFANSTSENPKQLTTNIDIQKTIYINKFPFNTLSSDPVSLPQKSQDVIENIIAVLSHPRFRKGKIQIFNKYKDEFHQKISSMVNTSSPIKLVLPSLPFQNQNPLCSSQNLDHIDLAIHLMFMQLQDLVLSIEQIYAPGLQIIILCDGIVYAKLLGIIDLEKINNFRENCNSLLRSLGLEKKIKLIDMSWVVKVIPNLTITQNDIEKKLSQLILKPSKLKEYITSLERGMLFNLPCTDFDYKTLAELANQPLVNLPSGLQHQLRKAAIQYASFLLTLTKNNVVTKVFSDCIRATVHPKDAAQIPLHLVDRRSVVFPYNGVAVVSNSRLLRTGNLRHATRIMRLGEIGNKNNHLIKVVQEGQEDAFCYLSL
jgi:pyoverdine/dityrosine biosynthesis protein Dit1